MKPHLKLSIISLAVLGLATTTAMAVPDSNAPVIQLRDPAMGGCVENGATIGNCFTDLAPLLEWTWGIRRPSSSQPLLVAIGPGTFSINNTTLCGNSGYVTFRGAGRDNTRITSETGTNTAVIHVVDCRQLAFENLTITGSGDQWGVNWDGGGSSTWNNVVLEAPTLAWYDSLGGDGCTTSQRGTHKWFSSTIRIPRTASSYIGFGAIAYYSICGESWFWGSEIENLNINNKTGGSGRRVGILAGYPSGEVHFYGGNVKVVSDDPAVVGPAIGLAAYAGTIHIHGSGIDVTAVGNSPITALQTGAFFTNGPIGGEIHANQSSYVLRTGVSGIVNRIVKDSAGHVHAPYVWEHIPDTDGNLGTIDTNFTSINGADQTTVTATSDGYPHTAIYSTSCPASARWYDSVDRVCRNR